MNHDYDDFLQDDIKTSTKNDHIVLEMVHSDLLPSHSFVFMKLTVVQGFIGLITMLFCPQFNFSLTNSYELFHYFHQNFGHAVCMVLCGGIFLGTGALFASSIMTQGEVNRIRNSKFLYYTSLSIVAVSSFMTFGAEIYLDLVSFWMVGSISSGVILFELSRKVKLKFA